MRAGAVLLVILVSCVAVRGTPTLLCIDSAPDQLFLDEISTCRKLYPFCVDRGPSPSSASIYEVAILKDEQVSSLFTEVAMSQSQMCMFHWINMLCSATFPAQRFQDQLICSSICTSIQQHCIGVQCPPPGFASGANRCTDYYSETGRTSGTCTAVDGDAGGGGGGSVGSGPRSSGAGFDKKQFQNIFILTLGAVLFTRVFGPGTI